MKDKSKNFTYNGFTYWLKEYFDYKVVTGSEQQCMNMFKEELETYPISEYGTGVRERGTDKQSGEYKVVIRRFNTKELYMKHLYLPPTYVREGKIL